MDKYSYLSNAHPEYIDSLYHDYKKDADSVDVEFRKFFDGFEFALAQYPQSGSTPGLSLDEFKVFQMIEAYRNHGHLEADTNPIRKRKNRNAHLELEHFGLSDKDLNKTFHVGELIGIGKSTLQQIIDYLRKGYCGTMGFHYNYIRNKQEWSWFKNKIENNPNFKQFDIKKKEEILRKLNKAVVFEEFLGKKYIGEKRFSLEGGETAIPALHAIINRAANVDEEGVEEVVIGMAHRGRLNVLANIMGKTYEEVFNEFEGNAPQMTMGDGDVKYHLGFRSSYPVDNDKSVHLELMPNPSHLEAVDPVVGGFTRGKADTLYNSDFRKILPILIHGDAAVAGQGVVYETLQMCKLKGYFTGGTIHFVINNQIGFTTDFDDARSSDYCTSIAKTVDAPVIQVNGDDIEAVVFAAEMAAEYRQKFQKDIFIDMVCYRKHGHNESDDPKYTQPQLYAKISKHKNPRDIYSEKLASQGEIGKEIAKKLDEEFWGELQDRLDMVKENKVEYTPQPSELAWKNLRKAGAEDFNKSPKTSITKTKAKQIIEALITYPEGFSPLRKVQKYLENRREVMQENKSVDWAAAELMAYGSILQENHNVRMSGQDVKRGTFSHRHATIYDEKNGNEFNRLSNINDKQGNFYIYNSHLSEYAVLGFEYGYSLASPNALVLWEAQFGDFVNMAQCMIDQFITSGETKWNRWSGLVMLLPHGYEGQGPEHSSARLERFLQACSELNIVVTNITDSANFFHALRRQQMWDFRKPLINMSPKSLLRNPKTQSPIDHLFKGTFKEILDDEKVKDPKKVKRLLLCSGKIAFDLIDKKEEDKRDDVAVIRMEQLYPINFDYINKMFDKYSNAELYWVQEEPENMGAWHYILGRFYKERNFTCVARKMSSSPATGYKKQHLKEQEDLINRAFA